MNTQDNSPSATPPQSVFNTPISWKRVLRRLLVCNPFFLVSAMLLLFGVNRLSLDQGFLGNERDNLLFNFGALQFYAGLLTATAIVLSRRRVWYDSALLVVLDHGLVLVPFILIGQAALIGPGLGRLLVVVGVVAAIGRSVAIGRWYPQFNLPRRALALGGLVLLANIVLPFWFRSVVDHESVWDWLGPNRLVWLIAVPLLAAGANLLPRPNRYEGLNPERSWLPLCIYTLWLAATTVHVASVGHLASDVKLTAALVAPFGMVVAWTLWNRLSDFFPAPALWMEEVVLLVAAAMPVFAMGDQPVFLALSSLSAVGFTILAVRRSDGVGRLAQRLAAGSMPLVLAGLPESIRNLIPGHPTPAEMLTLSVGVFALAYGWRWRHPAVSIVGASVFLAFADSLHPMLDSALKYQLAMAVVIGHSLRWTDQSAIARYFRIVLSIAWTGTFYMTTSYLPASPAIPVLCGLLVLGEWAVSWWMAKRLISWAPLLAAVLVIFSRLITYLLEHATEGLLAMAGSLALFGIGAAYAWNRRPAGPTTESPGVTIP